MSYILEALKRSQQERELGQVPRLGATELFGEERETSAPSYWGLLAVGLAALAVVISLYAALRAQGPAPVAASSPPKVEPTRPLVHSPTVAAASPVIEPPTPKPAPAAAPPAATRAEAPPPKRPVRVASPEPPPRRHQAARVPDAEAGVARQMEADRLASMQGDIFEDENDPPPVPVPPDLIADVERFKSQVRREQGGKSGAAKPKRVKLTGDLTRFRLTPDQQATLPAYIMTAHVYDADRSKRFVVINSLKYREGEDTREGLKVERIAPDGTVLSFAGNPFFVPR